VFFWGGLHFQSISLNSTDYLINTYLLMSQILDPVPSDRSDPIYCCYVNSSSRVQITRITNVENWYFERVAFPGQRLVFEAPMNAYLEIHTGHMASAVLSDRIPCVRLQIEEQPPEYATLSVETPPETQPVRADFSWDSRVVNDSSDRPLASTAFHPNSRSF
jgi:hypothetical protein